MNKYETKKDEIKRGLECCSAVGFETGCSDCPYRYRCKALVKDALNIITEQEKKIEQLTRELAKEQEACVECELEQSWELFVRDKEIDRLRAESKRFENNMKSVLEIEKENVRKETAKEIYERLIELSENPCNDREEIYKEVFGRYGVEVEEWTEWNLKN